MNIVTIDQMPLNELNEYYTEVVPAYPLWKLDGEYEIRVQHGDKTNSNSITIVSQNDIYGIQFDKWGNTHWGKGITYMICPSQQPAISIEKSCYPYSISEDSKIKSTYPNKQNTALVFNIFSSKDGILTLESPHKIIEGLSIILVDNQEWSDYEMNDEKIMINFPAETEKIEIVGTKVIPEFGTIAMMILIVSITSIIMMAKIRLILLG